MKKKEIRRTLFKLIEILGYAFIYFGCLFSLLNFPGYEFLTVIISLMLFAAFTYLPDKILWEIEFKERSEKY